MKCRMMAFHQFTSVKKHVPKTYCTIEMQPNIFSKIFLVPYAFTGCNLQVGKFDVSASNMIVFFFASIFHQAQVNGQWKRIRRWQLVQANIAGPQ